MNLESLEFFRTFAFASLTTLGLFTLSRLIPAYDRMLDESFVRNVTYDLCLAAFLVFTLSFFFAGLGIA
jgi:hypothetical protein